MPVPHQAMECKKMPIFQLSVFSCCSAVVFFLGTFLLMIMAVLDTFFLLYQQRKSRRLDKVLRSFQQGKTIRNSLGLDIFLHVCWSQGGFPQGQQCPRAV